MTEKKRGKPRLEKYVRSCVHGKTVRTVFILAVGLMCRAVESVVRVRLLELENGVGESN